MLIGSPVAIVVGICCVLPLAWLVFQVAANPSTLRALWPDPFQRRLLARTLLYNGAVAAVATVVALPAAIVLGRGRGRAATVLWFVLPAALLMPSLAYAYGWKQFLRLLHVDLVPAGAGDVLRCILTLAAWLWPLPAGILGLALRRMDSSLQQQALLDGALWRITARQLAGPLAASLACVTVLATQEFAVYEPTGISVVATEVRMVFETGLYSSPSNPITAPLDGGEAPLFVEQHARAAAAIATAFPLLVAIGVFGAVTLRGARHLSAAEELDVDAWPRALEPGWFTFVLAYLALAATLITPAAAMVLSLSPQRSHSLGRVLSQFGPQVSGSVVLASAAAVLALVVAFAASVRGGAAWALAASLVTFLAGGQLLAIALIRLYNRPALEWVYDSPAPAVMAYFGRFGWLALLAAAATRRPRPWQGVRDLAGVDGAGDFATARHVVWPLAWPVLGAAAVLVGVLALTEVPATVLISPLSPRPLVPMLMTWVHMLRYDDMLEGSPLLMGIVLVLALVVAGLVRFGFRLARTRPGSTLLVTPPIAMGGLCVLLASLAGCGERGAPDDVWLRTGPGPGQVAYPRAIDYNPKDDSFWVVDKLARVQHLDRSGNYLGEFRMPESLTGKPTGITVGPDGNLYVPDTHYQRVIVYTPEGKEIRRWGSLGSGLGQFIYPTDVAFDDKGRVFVSEYGDNARIQVFDQQGTFLYAFGRFGQGDGELTRPQSMVIDDGLVYVTDGSNHRIAVFKTDGTFVRNMGSVGTGPGQFRWPYGLCQDRDGNLVVCEFGNNRVQRIDKKTGKGMGIWGSEGRSPGHFAYPWAVAVDKRNRVVAVDSGNDRLQVFEF